MSMPSSPPRPLTAAHAVTESVANQSFDNPIEGGLTYQHPIDAHDERTEPMWTGKLKTSEKSWTGVELDDERTRSSARGAAQERLSEA